MNVKDAIGPDLDSPVESGPMKTLLFRNLQRGLTLVELLVVLSVIGLSVALLLPAVQKSRAAADRLKCENHLRQLAIATHHSHDAHGYLPTGTRLPVIVGQRPARGTNLWIELLPYLEQSNLQQRWDYRDNRNNARGGKDATTAQVIQTFLCPSDPLPEPIAEVTGGSEVLPRWSYGFYGLTSYGGNAGRRSFHPGDPPDFPRLSRDGIFFLNSKLRLADVSDGTSNTFMFGERLHHDPQYDRIFSAVLPGVPTMAKWGKWGFVVRGSGQVTLSTPVPINYTVPLDGDRSAVEDRLCAFGSGHSGGANFAFVDGSVRFLSETIPLCTLQALSTRAGNEIVSADDP